LIKEKRNDHPYFFQDGCIKLFKDLPVHSARATKPPTKAKPMIIFVRKKDRNLDKAAWPFITFEKISQ